MKTKLILVTLLTLILLLIQRGAVTAKVLLLISEQFPQVRVKPLHVFSKEPKHEYLSLGNGVVADLFLPNRTGKNRL